MAEADWWADLTTAAAEAGVLLVGLSVRDLLPEPPTDLDPPRLCVRDELHQVVIGPLHRPGRAGCPGCADLRRWAAHPGLAGLRRLRTDKPSARIDPAASRSADDPTTADPTTAAVRSADLQTTDVQPTDVQPTDGQATDVRSTDGFARPSWPPTALVSGPIRALLRALLLDELDALIAGRTPRTDRHVLTVGRHGEVRRHPLVPHPACAHCSPTGPVGGFEPPSGRIPPTSPEEQLADPYAVRGRDLSDEYDHWFETVVDSEFGVLGEPSVFRDCAVPTSSVAVGVAAGQEPELGWGRAGSRRHADLIGAAEALERLGGMRPPSPEAEVIASFRELGDRALDPDRLGLYPEERYGRPGFPFVRYHPDRPMSWVPGWSMTRRRPLLVPSSCAYFRYFHGIGGVTGEFRPPYPDAPDAPFVFQISAGTALGSSFDEAVFHGLLELVERDAFLLTWYARLPVPEIALASARDRRPVALAALLRARTGFSIRCYDTTLDTGIPSVWLLAVHERNGRHLAAAGAGLRPESAATAALVELAANLEVVPRLADAEPDRAAALAADPSRVRVMLDHSLANAAPEAAARFDFLTDRPVPTRGFAEVEADAGWPEARTVEEHLAEALRRFDRLGLEVIAVDTTRIEHQMVGLRCVKVIVPGLLPMTFGHDCRRVDGLPRLSTVPYDLGYSPGPLRSDDLNTLPHPFP